ncbi:MAG: arginase family protein [Streptosporangiaceae bacterium]
MSDWTVIGAPTSAGAHHAGQELAPAALRKAGLLDRLEAAGVSVTDGGDLPATPFEVDHDHPRARNLAAVVRVAGAVADAVAAVAGAGGRPLVVGGDCTITLGVIAGMRRRHRDVGLAYVDGDADLEALRADFSGILDSAGIAHLLGYGEPELTGLAGEPPLLPAERLALVGCDPREVSDDERRLLADAGVSYCEADSLAADPRAVAAQALTALRRSAGPVIVHFDVDVVDSADLPLGNFPHYGSGVRLEHAGSCLRVLLADPACAGLVLAEVNPSHDPHGGQLARYVSAVAAALAP